MSVAEDARTLSIQANVAVEEFSKLYYESFDKRRQALPKIYQEKANVIWNGHALNGIDAITKFFDGLPASEHTIEGMDTQPIVAGALNEENSKSIVVTFCGKVNFTGSDSKSFTQTFILYTHDNKWKIASDVFRYSG